MMQYLLFLCVFLLAGPALADVKFMQIGDPQVGKEKINDGTLWSEFEGVDTAGIYAYQIRALHGLLQYAEDIGVNNIIFMGDMTDNSGAGATPTAQKTALRTELQEHASLTFDWVLGNHDMETSCKNLPISLIDVLHDNSTRTPLWQTLSIGKVRLFLLTSNIWAYNWPNCQPDGPDATLPALYDDCVNESRVDVGDCNTGTVSDGLGVHTCGALESCVRYDDYAVAQMTAFTEAVAAYEVEYAAGTANVFGYVSHHMAWNQDNVDTQNSNNNAFHNFRRCAGGVDDGEYCSELAAWTCTVACTTAVAGFDMRTQFETAAIPLSTTLYGFTGHIHRDLCYPGDCDCSTPDTTDNGVDYCFAASAGTAVPYIAGEALTGKLWTCNNAGLCTSQTLLATPQSVEIHGASLSGVTLP